MGRDGKRKMTKNSVWGKVTKAWKIEYKAKFILLCRRGFHIQIVKLRERALIWKDGNWIVEGWREITTWKGRPLQVKSFYVQGSESRMVHLGLLLSSCAVSQEQTCSHDHFQSYVWRGLFMVLLCRESMELPKWNGKEGNEGELMMTQLVGGSVSQMRHIVHGIISLYQWTESSLNHQGCFLFLWCEWTKWWEWHQWIFSATFRR